MAGQPQYMPVLHFDVTALEISETAHPIWEPSMIVSRTAPFNLACSFQGSGIVWQWIKAWGITFRVSYHAEGIGFNASEVDLGSVNGTTSAAKDVYGPADTTLTVPPGRLNPGVYKVACVVTFDNAPGLTGFFDTLVIQVYE